MVRGQEPFRLAGPSLRGACFAHSLDLARVCRIRNDMRLPKDNDMRLVLQVLVTLLAVTLLLRARGQQAAATPQLFTYEVVQEYAHDPNAFTQGLDFDRNGTLEFFWESTGVSPSMSISCFDWAGPNSRSVVLHMSS
jgi:hypothetical protein